jgi:hypothetical protein
MHHKIPELHSKLETRYAEDVPLLREIIRKSGFLFVLGSILRGTKIAFGEHKQKSPQVITY